VSTPLQWKKVLDGDYVALATLGRKILAKSSKEDWDDVLRGLMAKLPNRAVGRNEGNIPVVAAWKFDKHLNPQLKPDGSNFFDLAEKIK
jgi:hypothetical protein